MTDRKTQTDDAVEALLAQAKSDRPVPSDALMARVLADADAAQIADQGPDLSSQAKSGLWHQIWQGLGGWPALGGLATATCAGVWLGVYPPQSMATVTETLLGGSSSVSPLIDMSLEGAFDLTQEAL